MSASGRRLQRREICTIIEQGAHTCNINSFGLKQLVHDFTTKVHRRSYVIAGEVAGTCLVKISVGLLKIQQCNPVLMYWPTDARQTEEHSVVEIGTEFALDVATLVPITGDVRFPV